MSDNACHGEAGSAAPITIYISDRLSTAIVLYGAGAIFLSIGGSITSRNYTFTAVCTEFVFLFLAAEIGHHGLV